MARIIFIIILMLLTACGQTRSSDKELSQDSSMAFSQCYNNCGTPPIPLIKYCEWNINECGNLGSTYLFWIQRYKIAPSYYVYPCGATMSVNFGAVTYKYTYLPGSNGETSGNLTQVQIIENDTVNLCAVHGTNGITTFGNTGNCCDRH
jgi:hypothetical protein